MRDSLIYGGATKPHPISRHDPSMLVSSHSRCERTGSDGHKWDGTHLLVCAPFSYSLRPRKQPPAGGPIRLDVNSQGELPPTMLVTHRQAPNPWTRKGNADESRLSLTMTIFFTPHHWLRVTDGPRISGTRHEEIDARGEVVTLLSTEFWAWNLAALGHIDFKTGHDRSTISCRVRNCVYARSGSNFARRPDR